MLIGFIVLLTALAISAVAIYYSVAGLAAIFAAAVVPIVIMGSALEIGKLVTAVWLHKYWSKATWWLKTYLTGAVLILMFITSMGIFGFLSKAHIDQTSLAGDNTLQIQQFDNRIAREQKRITDAELVIGQLDKAVQALLDANRIRGSNGAIATREAQKSERENLNKIINEANSAIAQLQDEKLKLTTQQVKLEAEVGPIKYIADFIYGKQADKNMLEEAVRWVIIIIIFVFDPLAVLLLVASQYTFAWAREEREKQKQLKAEENKSALDQWNEMVQEAEKAAVKEGNNELVQQDSPQEGGDEKTTASVESDVGKDDAGNAKEQEVPNTTADAGATDNGRNDEPGSEVEPADSKKKEPLKSLDLSDDEPLTAEEQARADEYNQKELNSTFQNAKTTWKAEHPDQTLKMYKTLYIKGKINKLPWEDEAEVGYQQNSEQDENTLFNKIKRKTSE